jgi:flagellar biosynthesis GTPase FlhF
MEDFNVSVKCELESVVNVIKNKIITNSKNVSVNEMIYGQFMESVGTDFPDVLNLEHKLQIHGSDIPKLPSEFYYFLSLLYKEVVYTPLKEVLQSNNNENIATSLTEVLDLLMCIRYILMKMAGSLQNLPIFKKHRLLSYHGSLLLFISAVPSSYDKIYANPQVDFWYKKVLDKNIEYCNLLLKLLNVIDGDYTHIIPEEYKSWFEIDDFPVYIGNSTLTNTTSSPLSLSQLDKTELSSLTPSLIMKDNCVDNCDCSSPDTDWILFDLSSVSLSHSESPSGKEIKKITKEEKKKEKKKLKEEEKEKRKKKKEEIKKIKRRIKEEEKKKKEEKKKVVEVEKRKIIEKKKNSEEEKKKSEEEKKRKTDDIDRIEENEDKKQYSLINFFKKKFTTTSASQLESLDNKKENNNNSTYNEEENNNLSLGRADLQFLNNEEENNNSCLVVGEKELITDDDLLF